MLIQGALLTAAQLHPLTDDTLMLPAPPVAPMVRLAGDIV
jgi:hypothetical protein